MSPNLMVGIKGKNDGPADSGMQPQTERTTRSFKFLPLNGFNSQKCSAEEREQGTN
jgi:hypothetical protein